MKAGRVLEVLDLHLLEAPSVLSLLAECNVHHVVEHLTVLLPWLLVVHAVPHLDGCLVDNPHWSIVGLALRGILSKVGVLIEVRKDH